MTGKDKVVMRSIEAPGGQVCVDLYRRADGSWGWSEYRRDPEDPHGWRDPGGARGEGHPDAEAALSQACAQLVWLQEALRA